MRIPELFVYSLIQTSGNSQELPNSGVHKSIKIMENNNTFLPEDYKLPDSSGYMKFHDGENTFRILSSAIIGYEYWTGNNKPVRSRKPFGGIPVDIRFEKDGLPSKIKHFWAFAVYNYDTKAIQILEITQSTIQGGIKAIVDNSKWGHPSGYDITITKKGEGFDTEYHVMPSPHSQVDENIMAALKAKPINLEAIFTGENPFDVGYHLSENETK